MIWTHGVLSTIPMQASQCICCRRHHRRRLVQCRFLVTHYTLNNKQTNKNLRCGNRKGLLGRNDQTHHRMGPKTMESIPPSKRNTQADKQTNKQEFKVRQPQRAAKSKRPNAPSDGSKNNGIHTTKQEEYPSRHPTTDTANKSPAGD